MCLLVELHNSGYRDKVVGPVGMVAEKASPKFEGSVVLEHIEEAMRTKLVEKVVLSLNKNNKILSTVIMQVACHT